MLPNLVKLTKPSKSFRTSNPLNLLHIDWEARFVQSSTFCGTIDSFQIRVYSLPSHPACFITPGFERCQGIKRNHLPHSLTVALSLSLPSTAVRSNLPRTLRNTRTLYQVSRSFHPLSLRAATSPSLISSSTTNQHPEPLSRHFHSTTVNMSDDVGVHNLKE